MRGFMINMSCGREAGGDVWEVGVVKMSIKRGLWIYCCRWVFCRVRIWRTREHSRGK